MAKNPTKKEDLARIRAALQKETAGGASVDQAFAKVWEELPEVAERVTKAK